MEAQTRVLIVEDESITALDLQQVLLSSGYDCAASVNSGEAAIETCERQRPDLVLMDIHLQGEMDGIQAGSRIGADLGIPIVYLTAYADDRTLARAKITEPYGYVLKPFDARELQIAIEIALYRHRTQRRLEETLSELREADRLKSNLMRNVSHELRTPLALVLGYTELLASGSLGELSELQQQAATVAVRRCEELKWLVEDITMLLSIGDTGDPDEDTDLAAVLGGLITEYGRKSTGAGVNLTATIEEDLPPVAGSRTRLHRVFGNLLSNAAKFTPSGGSVSVTCYRSNGHVVTEVSDTGIGIPECEFDHVFERFYQVDGSPTRRYGGTGLGLAVVKETVEALGGDVNVQSEVGQGSRFTVRLPAEHSGAR
jgi:two-component system, sensor histidine kinase